MTALRVAIVAIFALLGSAVPVAAQAKHNCSFCHDLHGGSYAALSNFATSEELCLSCHGPAGPEFVDRDGVQVAVPKNVVIHNGLKHSAPTSCWSCHDHQGESGTNLGMIPLNRTGAAAGATRPVLFTARTGSKSYADGDATYDGVCEVCHTTTVQHRYDGSSGKHNAAANCTGCHKHSGGFQGTGGRCTACHNQTQGGRRVVVTDFGRISHHVDWQAAGLASADSIPDADCQACHDQSQHQQGNVRLWNVDLPGDTAASIVLTGDPNTVSSEATKLEPFCKACHDANGANGDVTPFSDNATRPLIDATQWNASSHSTSASVPAGCYGNGTTGCHGSAHGSEKRKMLAPFTVGAIAPALTEEQEGFCFTCHGTGGAATSKIGALFARAINWVQQATGLNANANLNDRHDVQYAAQSRSGAKVECTNCHNPHTANSQRKYVLDPDPADGHVVGTNWYFTAYQAAGDTLSEFCLDCHDGSFPAGVLGQTTPITNIRTTWVNDGMGQRTSSNVNLRAGTGWAIGDVMPCRACHVAHLQPDADVSSTPNLFGMVDTLRNKAGTAYLFFNGGGRNDPDIYKYALTNNLSSADSTSGGYFCNACHDRTAMTGKVNCYTCHHHGDGGRF